MAASPTNREKINRIRRRFCDGGQGHIFDWWDELSKEEKDSLIGQLAEIDIDLIKQLAAEHLGGADALAAGKAKLEPAPVIPIPRKAAEKKRERTAAKKGEEVLRSGQTAVFVVAGGQSSRLGLAYAKGIFPIMPISGKSLFQHHAEKVLALSRRYKVSIPLFLMTSQVNNEETKTFFEENGFFGLEKEDVFFLPQGMLPSIDFSGRITLKKKGALFMSPDGHGGALKTLARHAALDELKKRGIRYLFYFQVDNPLVRILDPVFLGHHVEEGAEMSSKVVEKKDPGEKVGVIGMLDGKPGVIEYSDLDKKEMNARGPDGRLLFSAGSIAIHLLNVAFIDTCNQGEFSLPYHKAEKKIPFLDETGVATAPEEPNGIKFETFVFDALRYAKKTVTMEVRREEEFAPVKNPTGEDSPDTSREALTALFRTWLEAAGFEVDGDGSQQIEISPLFALDADEFTKKVGKKNILSSKLYIQ
jgi:UDP-N-acetylglucosamine/UDP-N-acetylgalactosamine diphosphorylase